MSMVQIIELELKKYYGLSTYLDFLIMVFTNVRLQGEKYPLFYSNIVFFITDLCCLGVDVLCKLPLDLYMHTGHRSNC